MSFKIAAKFKGAANKEKNDILNAIRVPESDFLTDYYLAHKSADVILCMKKMITAEEGDAVVSFLAKDAKRFETLAEKGFLNALLDVMDTMGKSQQARILGAVESVNYGTPNTTILQKLLSTKDDKVQERLGGFLRGLDTAQTTKLLSQPGAAWWMSSYERDDLMVEMVSSLSQKQRQYIVGHSSDIGRAISASACDELTALFKDCKFPKGKAPHFGP